MTARVQIQGQTNEPVAIASAPALQRACSCGGSAGISGKWASCAQAERLGVQPKLTVNAPNDRYEQEADRIADQVVSSPAPITSGPLSISPLLQRDGSSKQKTDLQTKPDPVQRMDEGEEELQTSAATVQRMEIGEEEDELQRDAMDDEKEEMQAKHNAPPTPQPGPAFANALSAESAGGVALSRSTLSSLEPRLGRDLSSVRIHDTSRAADLSRQNQRPGLHSAESHLFRLRTVRHGIDRRPPSVGT